MPERLDFKAIAEAVDIFEVAQYANLKVVKNRAACPVCESDRAIEFYPETNTFHCHHAKVGADCISLLAHVKGYQGQYRAAKEIQERFLQSAPQEKPKPQPLKEEKGFDPDKFKAKLTYTEEVKDLGLSERDAKLEMVGFYRGHLYFPRIYDSGVIAGWWKLEGEKLVPPKAWLPNSGNVVVLRKRPA